MTSTLPEAWSNRSDPRRGGSSRAVFGGVLGRSFRAQEVKSSDPSRAFSLPRHLDRLLFLVVAHPIVAALVGVVLVALVFVVLLTIGPPVPSR